ncbi:hypothetical protein ONE63_009352 [Megalurothrips usitatus]|uniref:Cytochrome P450 4C1-like n=1 Tax=Megalurothrips usitatus TaxID=439358 RepID=A0AAV7XNG3_9NEOP|nr:hypothetical protein ONE63_009352 [Megalurothrips usitatus]
MDPITLALLLVFLAGATYLLSQRRKWVRQVDLIPGPPAIPILGNTWDIMWRFKFNQTRTMEAWTKKYGDVFRFWVGCSVPVVVLVKPEDVEIILSSNKHIEKSYVYRQLHPWIGTGLLTSSGKKWHTRRKLITPTFHFRILDQFIEVFNRHSDILVSRLLKTSGTINIHEFMTLCTLDVICETAMGTKVNAQKEKDSSYVTAIHDVITSFHARTMKPWLHGDALFNVSKDGRTFNKALTVLHKYTRDVVESRRRERESNRRDSLSATDKELGMKKRIAFLDQLLQASDSSGKPLLDDGGIQEEVDTFMFEGHDTTAAGISFILYNIAAHPEVQDKLAEEMDDIFGDSSRPATSQDLQNMKYAERVVKESLRLYPSVPVFGRSIHEDLPITGGHVIPAGCSVAMSVLLMGRNAKHWPNPEKFDPDRFLPENTVSRHPYAYVPFSAGARNCIGQKFAMMEMKSTVSKVIRHCKLSLPYPGYKPEVEGRAILKANDGVLLRISPR